MNSSVDKCVCGCERWVHTVQPGNGCSGRHGSQECPCATFRLKESSETEKAGEKPIPEDGDVWKKFEEFMKREDELRRFSFPIEVSGVDWKVDIGVKSESIFGRREPKPGSFVAIRSLKEGHGEKTHLGLLVGYVPIHAGLAYDKQTKRLRIDLSGDNPAIFVFDFGQVVLGAESYWGPIKDEQHLRQITNNDIENVWYVKALKALATKAEEA